MSPRPAPNNGGATTPIRPKPRQFLWIAVCAALAAGAAIYAARSRVLPIDAIAVPGFVSDGAPDWLSGAIGDEILDAVRPAMKDSADTKHRAVLEGRVSRSGDRVRVTATLTRGDGHRYWTKTVERPTSEIARAIAATIVPSLRKKSAGKPPTPAAYDSFLEGRHLFALGRYSNAVEAFNAAAQADPGFARAFAWTALAREALADQGAARANDILPAARDAAERAVTLAPDSAEAHLALGIVKLQYDWDWDASRGEIDRALQLSPRHPLAVLWSDRWLAAMNRAPAPALPKPNVPSDPEAARQFLAQAEDLRSKAYVTPIQFALAAEVAQDPDSLFHWLNVAYEERCAQLPFLLRSPALPQSDPRLRELIQRLKLPTNP